MKRIIRKLKNSNKVMLFFYIVVLALYLLSVTAFSYSLARLAGIETLYRYLSIVILVLLFVWILIGNYKNVIKRKKTKFILSMIISVIISLVLLFGSYLINMIYGSIDNLTEDEKIVYTSYLITLKDEEISKNSKLGMIKDNSDVEGNVLAKKLIKKYKLKNDIVYYDTYVDLLNDMYNKEITGSFVSANYKTLFSSVYPEIASETKVRYKYSKKMINKDLELNSNKKLTEPFTMLLMGVDTESSEGVKSNSSFNGDTLMLIAFNPKTLNATVFSIPRDLYVPISCRNNNLNKINSSAAGGTSCVIDTIENLIGIDIDYYAKINFKGVVDLVDAVGGVDIDVQYSFCEQDSHRDFTNQKCLDKGYQHVDGEEALAFARHRYTLPAGDLTRIQNQQILVEALARQMVNLNSLNEMKDVLNAVSNNVSVNMTTNQILSSYDILKSMVINTMNGESALTLNKTYLEVYDNPVYLPNGMYSATLGYYEKSLEDIITAMKVNLDIEKPELVKTFYYDANTIYEKKVAGKNIKVTDNNIVMKDFIGKRESEVEQFCNMNDIELTKEYVDSTSEYYNSSVSDNLVANQSIKEGTEIQNISSMTIYINKSN